MNKLIVISGCSGGGKSTLLTALNREGYSVIPEVGRVLVRQQLSLKSGITPWENPINFCEMLIEKSVEAYHLACKIKNPKQQVIFFDRCILEGISYYQKLDIADAHQYDHFIDELRYYSTILMAPPWEEIFCQDEERKHSFQDAVAEYERLLASYISYDYKLVELPKVNVQERLRWVLSFLADS